VAITGVFSWKFLDEADLKFSGRHLAADWPAGRLVAIWNSLPGVTPAKGFKNPKAAASKIWGRIQSMAESENPIEAAPKSFESPRSVR
jgi:hypothetical protein